MKELPASVPHLGLQAASAREALMGAGAPERPVAGWDVAQERFKPRPDDCFAGGGEMGALMRSIDWSKTVLGPVERWSLSLRMMVSFLLANRFPLLLWWGPNYISIYNDAYRPILGNKHPQSLGQPVSECWSEIWHILKPLIDTPFTGGAATWMDDIFLEINRSGFVEETHFTIAYSPVPDETAPRGIGGVLATVHEITEKVVAERRAIVLRDLGVRPAEAKTAQEACAIAADMLAGHAKDVPFALFYLIDPDRRHARLASAVGIAMGDAASPLLVPLDESEGENDWPLAQAVRADAAVAVEDLSARFSNMPAGPWSDPPRSAVIVPIRSTTAHRLAGLLVAGVSSRLKLDGQYLSFLELAARQVATAIATARAYEEERKRAEALAEIDRAKTAFFSNVSHEFRTPLTLVLGPIEDALADEAEPLGSRQRERAATAQRNGIRLQKLVNALLDFSRVEAGRMHAAYRPTDLATLTRDLASNFRSVCDKAGIELLIQVEALPEPVYVDPEMWEKVVLNLISNAFKFTLEGRITVSLRADDGHAVLCVDDTGIGIPEEEIPQVFNRFHRVAGARGRTYEGTGIGLSLVREVVRQHRGSIDLESSVGRGTTLTVRLPFGRDHLPQDRIDATRAQSSTATHADAFVGEALRWLPDAAATEDEGPDDAPTPSGESQEQRPRLLLADDNADMRAYLYRLLASTYDVAAVADGDEALAAAKRWHPDLVLTDVMMPGLDGFELLERLRADAELRDIPVIMLSARAGEEAKVEGLRMGADDYLVKPFSARELLARVRNNLVLARTRSENARMLREEAHMLELLNKISSAVAAELDLERAVQVVTDAATELTGAAVGSFICNVTDEKGGGHTLYALSGALRETFAKFPKPRNIEVFGPILRGEGIIRSADITRDRRYEKNSPWGGMVEGHLPVRSYLAAPVASRSGEVIGGLFFGHPDVGIFDERSERVIESIAAQAGIAIDNARLFRAAQDEIEQRKTVEAALRQSEETLESKVIERTAQLSASNEQLLAEAEKREHAESGFRLLVEGVVDYAIYRVDPAGFITSWNTGAERIKGYRASEIIGEHFGRFYTDADRVADLPADTLRMAAKAGTFEGEGWRVRKDGSRFWASVVVNPIYDSAGVLLGFAKVTRDLTERRLAEEQVRQSQKMEAVGQLTGGIAHDFNNLLTVISGNIEALQRRLPPGAEPDLRRFADSALRGAERAAILTHKLLAFSRRQPLAPKVTSVNALIAGISEMLRRTLGESIAIETVVAGGVWPTYVDAHQLEAVLLNLAINARDAMPDGGHLTIEAANVSLEPESAAGAELSPGQYVGIFVSDTGSGMSPEVASKAFDPFFTTKEVGHGTGLGLSQVYGFIKQSGGHVKIASKVGEGTTVRLYLPRHLSAGGIVEAQEAAASIPHARGETVLVVEDDASVRSFIVEMLRELGYTVMEAHDGAAGLRMLDANRQIKLLFTDVGLPGRMNGRQLADEARQRDPGLKVLFTSGYPKNAIGRRGWLDPGVELIMKPFTYAALAERIRRVLDAS